jgi:hypothetical protein
VRPEYAALLALANPLDGGAAQALARLRTPGDQRRFSALARDEGAAGHLWFELLRRRLTGALAPAAALALRESYETNLRVNALRHADLHGLLTALAAEGLAALPAGMTLLVHAGLVPTRGVCPWPELALAVYAPDTAGLARALAAAGFRVAPGAPGRLSAANARATALTVELLSAPAPADPRAAVLREAARLDALGHTTLAAELGRLYLGRHPAGAALGRAAFADAPALAAALAARYAAPGFAARLRAVIFPPGPEMVKTHGPRAAGFGLYRLYAQRLLQLRRSLRPTPRDGAGAP